MHGEYIYLDDKTIRLYIKKYGKNLDGKDYELGAAIILKGFFEVENNFKCIIGIKISPKYLQYYEKRQGGALNVEEVKDLIEIHQDQNDIVDLAISPLPSFRGNRNSAWAIQFKRFGHFQKNKKTEGLKELLLKTKSKYAKTNTILVILFDGHQGLRLREISNLIKSVGFPFSRIMFINPIKKTSEQWKIYIGEIWPNYGFNEYNPNVLVKKLSEP